MDSANCLLELSGLSNIDTKQKGISQTQVFRLVVFPDVDIIVCQSKTFVNADCCVVYLHMKAKRENYAPNGQGLHIFSCAACQFLYGFYVCICADKVILFLSFDGYSLEAACFMNHFRTKCFKNSYGFSELQLCRQEMKPNVTTYSFFSFIRSFVCPCKTKREVAFLFPRNFIFRQIFIISKKNCNSLCTILFEKDVKN